MLKFYWILITFCLTAEISAQSISGFNLSYEYDPDSEISFRMRPVRQGNQIRIYYELRCNRSEYSVNDYLIAWEKRNSFNVRSGESLEIPDSVLVQNARYRTGFLNLSSSEKNWYAVVSITNQMHKGVWNYYTMIETNWPVEFMLSENGQPLISNYINTGKTYDISRVKPAQKLYGYFYKSSFNAAAPPFSMMGSDDRFIKADSLFVITGNEFAPTAQGLYLIQSDTLSSNGLSVYAAKAPFPKYNNIRSLTNPLIYLTTADEQKQLAEISDDKSRFDKLIIDMVGDAGRARTFMRSYYQRVERANQLFTGYKEGWKTDMGMIYMIFGVPSEVSRTTSYEIWYYKGTGAKFNFSRTGSIFAPVSYFLNRNKNYAQDWYTNIDLWRKSRF